MRRVPFLAALGLLCALGLVPRLWNLPAQVLSDDEMHTVRAALGMRVPEILTTYQLVDNCIPLTALWRAALDAGVRPSEMVLRLPALLSGALLLAVAPWWAARRTGRGTALALAALLAISPGLVFYSRIARSYAPIVLLGFGAVAAFEAWWRRPSWRKGSLYVVLAAGATWFHLGAATCVVAPFLFACGDVLIRRDWRHLRPLLGLGLATGLAFLAFLVPALDSLLALILAKHADAGLHPAEVLDLLRLQAGSARPVVAALFWLAAVLGFLRLFRHDRRLALYTATVVLGHLAGLLLLAPEGYQIALIFHRYLLVALPWVLLWTAFGLGHPWPAWPKAQPVLATLALVLLAASGPLAGREIRRSSFAHHNDYVGFCAPRPQPRPRQIPPFYRRLARSGAQGAVLEYPWMPVWRINRSFYLYQEVHGRELVVASPRPMLADPRLRFRNQAPATPAGILASRARWVVIHRDLAAEEARWPEPGAYPQPQVLPLFRRLFERAGPGMIRALRRAWGPPDESDRWVAVWDLQRVRSR
ncbi:MAG TPA: glycosyltransferase family 39 protein [Thermoanaerobaculia bacterium]|nr:glycosyltransferase family 39 protein [Thermoanaerobaculia bacterium]